MDQLVVYIIIGLVIITLSTIIFIVLKNKDAKQEIKVDESAILSLFNKDNIINIEYIRNKIVISFKDITLFNIEELHSLGISGISVIGDKIKFYLEGSNELNEKLYKSIKAFVEGKW